MSIDVKLRDQRDLVNFQGNLRTIKIQLTEFRKVKLFELANKLLLFKIKQRMTGALYPESIIERTVISDVKVTDNDFEIIVKSELILTNGFDLASGFEHGIREHDITGDPLVFENEEGELVFVTIVHHPGVRGFKIIETTVEEFKNIIKIEYDREERIWLEENLK